jgi:type I restriction enzyme S subunit
MNAERLLAHYERIADAPDAIDRLRRFILDLAVRGKLVTQDAADEPASELLKRIAMEKARLVKAGEIRKPKVPPHVGEPPFDLPRNWRWAPIREVASDRGQEIPRSTFTYIDVTAIDKEAGVVADPKVLEASEAPSRARKITRKGDVIYSCVRPYLLNVAVIENDFDPPPIASTAFAILNGHGLVIPRYLWIVLRSPFMVECVEENQRGQAYPAINDADFAALPFPLPPLAEQHRIVAKVDELMGLCDRLEAARAGREGVRDQLAAANLARLNAPDPKSFQEDASFALDTLPALTTRHDQIKRLRQTVLNLAVRGKLVPQDASDEPASELLKRIAKEKARLVKAGEVKVRSISARERTEPLAFECPKGWSLTNLGNASLKITDGAHKTPTYVAKGVPFISVKNFSGGKLDLSNTRFIPEHEHRALYQRCDPRRGDILIGRIGTLGKAVLVDTDIEFSIFVSVGLIRFDHGSLNPSFFRLLLNSPFVEAEFDRIKIGGGTHTNKLNLGDLYTVAFPLPPLAEQHRIVAKVDALMALCDRLEATLTATATSRRRLLDALLAEALAPADTCELEAAG